MIGSNQVRRFTTDGDCPHDYIKLYDGVDEYSPLIGQFCGVGSFPVSIIGTTNKLFLEFITAKHGPLLNTGLQEKNFKQVLTQKVLKDLTFELRVFLELVTTTSMEVAIILCLVR